MNTGPNVVDDVTIDLGVILRALWRARFRILVVTAVAAAAAFVGLSAMTPSYKSDTRIVIEAHEVPIGANSERQTEAERAILDEQGIGSQVQLLTSRDVARRVVAALDLAKDPEFAGGGLLRGLLADIGLGRSETNGTPEEKVLETFSERLTVFPLEKTRVIQVEFSSKSPDKAAKIAATVVDEYLKATAEAKGRNSADATKFLSNEIDQLRHRVAEAEAKVEQYRAGADLFVGQNNVKISEQQLGELNSQLTAAKAQRSETEARVRQLKRLLDGGSGLETASEVIASPIVQRLRERQVALKARAAELATTYLSNHPQVQAVNAQIADVETQIRAEAAKVLAGYENDLKTAEGRVKQLAAQFNEFKSQAAKAGEEDIQLRALEREAKAQRDQLEEFLGRYRDNLAKQSVGAQPADARVISAATVPAKPAFPKVVPLTSVIALVTFLICCTFVVMREFLSGNVLRPVASAAPVVVPPAAAAVGPAAPASPRDERLAAWRFEPQPPAPLLAHEPAAVFDPSAASAIAGVWSALVADGSDAERIVVTSATSDHAAHEAAVALMREAARRGAKVCLVDLSAGEDEIADLVADEDPPGLGELLAGEARFSEIIFRDRGSRGHVVLSGRSTLVADDLAGDELAGALEALNLTYDHLVIDLGLIAAGHGTADLVASAGAVVLAADGSGRDAATEKAAAALRAAGLPHLRVVAVDKGLVGAPEAEPA